MEHFSHKQRTLLKAIRECYSIAPACDRAGVGRTTCYRWLADAAFKEAVEDARQACVEDIESRHVEAAKGKCVISRIHFLKSHRREIYGDHGKIDVEHHNQPVFQPIPPEMLKKALAGVLQVAEESGFFRKAAAIDTGRAVDAEIVEVESPKLTEGERTD